MFLSVKELEIKKLRFDVDFAPGEIDFEENRLRQLSPMHAAGGAELLENTLGEIRVQGNVAVELEADCDRCLEPARFPIDSTFDLYYRPAITDVTHDIAIDAGEAEIAFYENDGLELGEVLREHILLSLPMQRVCRESCKGICPQCGQNRNADLCHCETHLEDDRWTALRALQSLQVTNREQK